MGKQAFGRAICLSSCTVGDRMLVHGTTHMLIGNAYQEVIKHATRLRFKRLSWLDPALRELCLFPMRVVQLPFPTDRKSVVYGKSVSVRVDLGGLRRIKKKITIQSQSAVFRLKNK